MLLDHAKPHPAPAANPPVATIRTGGPTIATVESPPVPLVVPDAPRSGSRPPLGLVGVTVAVLAWAFFPTLDWLVDKWYSDPSYSHGFLVPFISAYMVYRLRKGTKEWFGPPRPLLAAGLFAAILLLRGLAGGLLFNQLDALALLLSIATAVLALGGWTLLKNLAPGLLFLIFLVPLPYELEQNVGGPLKIVATTASTFLLQTIGYPAVATGNVIHIDAVELGVVDACNGLKMLVTFAAFGGGAVILLNRTWFEKFLIVLGVVPIALITNVLRITATGIAYTAVTDKATRDTIHDIAGLMMMPVGLALLGVQLWVLNRLVVKPTTTVETV